eukprot:COSAG06_NODE_1216_length_10221_cov_9.567477_5_plen_228_part_00
MDGCLSPVVPSGSVRINLRPWMCRTCSKTSAGCPCRSWLPGCPSTAPADGRGGGARERRGGLSAGAGQAVSVRAPASGVLRAPASGRACAARASHTHTLRREHGLFLEKITIFFPSETTSGVTGSVVAPTSSRRTLRSHPRRPLPTNPMPWGGRSRCWSPPTTRESSCSALGPERAVTRVRGGETWLVEREGPRATSPAPYTTFDSRCSKWPAFSVYVVTCSRRRVT